MNMNTNRKAGFTLAEAVIASGITAMAVGLSAAGLYFVLSGERQNSTQNQLDLDVRKATGRLSNDIRLSDVDKIYFYPAGPGPYTAISFPMAQTNASGLLAYDAATNLIWNRTVIYHVWAGSPSELRRTEFKANILSNAAQRAEQLASVVTNGNGSFTYQSAYASTFVVFQNLFTWSISTKGSIYDGYSPVVQRDIAINLGSTVLAPGYHSLKCTVEGKNPANVVPTGYKMGFDTLVVSPCAGEREAEAQLSYVTTVGPAAANEYMAGGDWSGNYRLMFPATAPGHSITFTFENDRWEETNFKGTGAQHENTETAFTNLPPYDFVTRLIPTTYYYTSAQTLDETGFGTSGGRLRACAVRVLVRGKNMPDGGILKHSGPLHCIWFKGGPLKVLAACVSECASETSYTMDAIDWGVLLGSGEYCVGSGEAKYYGAAPYYLIDKSKSYMFTFLVSEEATNCDAWAYQELHSGSGTNPPPPGCYVLAPGAMKPTIADMRNPLWSSYIGGTNFNVITTNLLFGLDRLHVQSPTIGTFTSQIIDTQLTTPVYQSILWNQVVPAGATLRLKIRSFANADASDATAWAAITTTYSAPHPATNGTALIAPGNKRFCQFQAIMTPAGDISTPPPALRNITIRWTGETRATDIGGTFARGPDHGIFDVLVDGVTLTRGITFNLEIFQTVYKGGTTQKVTSAVSAEIEPRNTGK